MTPRLYIDAPLSEGSAAPLDEGQAHYLRGVLRLSDGDTVLAFNARDGEYAGRMVEVGKKAVHLQLVARLRAPETEPDLWLLFAAVKRAALETIVQKAVELGALRLLPVMTARTHRERINEQRLAAIAIEAAEQCGRLSVPEIVPVRTLGAALADWPRDRRLYFCDEAGDDLTQLWGGPEGRARPMLDVLLGAPTAPAALLIGPEGGFAPDERTRLHGCDFVTPVTLGPRILRADTAAIVALAMWQAAQGDLKRT